MSDGTAATTIVVGQQYFVGDAHGYHVTVLDIHEETRAVKVHYDGYDKKYDAWLPTQKLSVVTGKRDRKSRRVDDDAKPPESTSPAHVVAVPGDGDAVQVFDVHTGWRSGTVEVRATSLGLGSIVRYDDGDATVVLFPMDFESGDVRWPKKQGGELEGCRVLVPPRVFGQNNCDRQGGYAGTIKRDTGWRATIYFPIDGKQFAFPLDEARGWLVAKSDMAANEEWAAKAPRITPTGWPGDVLFCSFPLQQGIHPVLLKRFCALSERMAGVEIRAVDEGHPLAGTSYNLGLFATRDFRQGSTVGQYAGMVEISGGRRYWSQKAIGRYDIALDTVDGLSSAQGLTLDAKYVGNEGRIINHFQGIAPEENVRFRTASHPTKGVWVDIITTHAIACGEEILADYDYGMLRDDDQQPGASRQNAGRRPQPPEAAAERFELGSVRSGADGCSQWRVAGSYEGYKEAASSKKRKQGSFRQRWVLVQEED